MEAYQTIINEIARINAVTGAPQLTIPVANLLDKNSKTIHVAVLGQFKSGKSSLVNSIVGQPIVPVGVVPVTAIVTRLQYGLNPRLIVRFINKKEITTTLDELPLYVTEKHNPENTREVALAIVEHPVMEPFKNISIVDTPGLSSFYRHNSEATLQWLPFTGVAIISISAERPLSEDDLNLIKSTSLHCRDMALVITKTDLFKAAEIEEIKSHIRESLKKAIPREIPLFEYSIFNGMPACRQTLIESFINPLNRDFEKKKDEIIRYKLHTTIEESIRYTELALHTVLKREQEKETISRIIKEIKSNRHHHEKEMLLTGTSFKNETRGRLEAIVLPYRDKIIEKLIARFQVDYPSWEGTLFRVSRNFEQWLKTTIGDEITAIDDECYSQVNQIVKEAAGYYEYSALQYRQRLNDRIKELFGVDLPGVSWQIEFSGIDRPDVSVFRAFDSHLDMLLFFLPMRWFKPLFYHHFRKQIPVEVEKNLYRYISCLTEKIIKSIDAIHRQALFFVNNETRDVEQILSNDKNNHEELQGYINRLKEFKSAIS